MSKLPGYGTNGSIHLITNNLIGFTAEGTSQRSTFTAGDIGLMTVKAVGGWGGLKHAHFPGKTDPKIKIRKKACTIDG